MEILKNAIRMTQSVSIYVPSTSDVSVKIDNSKYVKQVSTLLAKKFGGCTSFDAKGSYMSNDNNLIVEDVTICKAFTSIISDEDVRAIVNMAKYLCTELKQECVGIQINKEFYLIESNL